MWKNAIYYEKQMQTNVYRMHIVEKNSMKMRFINDLAKKKFHVSGNKP